MNHRLLMISFLAVGAVSCRPREFNRDAGSLQVNVGGTPDNCGDPEAANRTNPTHCEGPYAYRGGYIFQGSNYGSEGGYAASIVPVHRFGTLTLLDPMTQQPLKNLARDNAKIFRDQQYHVGKGLVGVRLIPVSLAVTGDKTMTKPLSAEEQQHFGNVPPKSIRKSEELDRILRKEFLAYDPNFPQDPKTPLWAIGSNFYPGQFMSGANEVGNMRQMGPYGHSITYIGNGFHRSSPALLHQNGWTTQEHEPTNVTIVGLKGAPQAAVNQNAYIVARILGDHYVNEQDGRRQNGPTFGDYNSAYNFSLKNLLDFYASWLSIDSPAKMAEFRSDPRFGIYCAEFTQATTGIALNLPHNEQGFVDVWGPEKGRQLFARAKAIWQQITASRNEENQLVGHDLPTVASFQPLWKLDGITNPTQATDLKKGLPWPLMTTADLVKVLMDNYGSFLWYGDQGPAWSSTMLVNTLSNAQTRIGLTGAQIRKLAIPIIQSSFQHFVVINGNVQLNAERTDLNPEQLEKWLLGLPNGATRDRMLQILKASQLTPDNANWVRQNIETILGQGKGALAFFAQSFRDPGRDEYYYEPVQDPIQGRQSGKSILAETLLYFGNPQARGAIKDMRLAFYADGGFGPERRAALARFYNNAFRPKLNKLIDDARALQGNAETLAHFSTPPALVTYLTAGMHPHNPNVRFRTVGTVVYANDVKFVGPNDNYDDTYYSLDVISGKKLWMEHAGNRRGW